MERKPPSAQKYLLPEANVLPSQRLNLRPVIPEIFGVEATKIIRDLPTTILRRRNPILLHKRLRKMRDLRKPTSKSNLSNPLIGVPQ